MSIQDVACIKTESIGDTSESSSQFSEIIFSANQLKRIEKLGSSETFIGNEPVELKKTTSNKNLGQLKPGFKKKNSNL